MPGSKEQNPHLQGAVSTCTASDLGTEQPDDAETLIQWEKRSA